MIWDRVIRRWGVLWVVLLLPCSMGGCPRPEDSLEPNDTPETATPLTIGQAIEGRVVQGNDDVFSVVSGPGQTLLFTMESLGEEEVKCAAFAVRAPGGTVLYEDQNTYCERQGTQPVQVSGAALEEVQGFGYRLRVPAQEQGQYYLTIRELGYVDNIFTYSWQYRLTATVE